MFKSQPSRGPPFLAYCGRLLVSPKLLWLDLDLPFTLISELLLRFAALDLKNGKTERMIPSSFY